MKTQKRPFDVIENIIAYENGELSREQVVDLFQHLVNTGLAWSLQGSYGRTAHGLIEAELVTPRTQGQRNRALLTGTDDGN